MWQRDGGRWTRNSNLSLIVRSPAKPGVSKDLAGSVSSSFEMRFFEALLRMRREAERHDG
jgi:hypothetical protein